MILLIHINGTEIGRYLSPTTIALGISCDRYNSPDRYTFILFKIHETILPLLTLNPPTLLPPNKRPMVRPGDLPGGSLTTEFWTHLGVAIFVVFLRCFARIQIAGIRKLRLDDWGMQVAVVFQAHCSLRN